MNQRLGSAVPRVDFRGKDPGPLPLQRALQIAPVAQSAMPALWKKHKRRVRCLSSHVACATAQTAGRSNRQSREESRVGLANALLVRPGNPKGIRGFRDLLAPGIKVLTVAGAGQTGLWEDVAGRTGDIAMVRAFRKNMVFPEAANSGAAKQQWTQQKDIDAWLIWNIWQVANPELAQVVAMDEPFRIYRDAGVVLTHKGNTQPKAKAFVGFLQSPAGQKIFAKWGWDAR